MRQVRFGDQGPRVSAVGLGGEGVLRTHGRASEAREVIAAALGLGLSYFDTAVAYAGSQNYLGAMWQEQPQKRAAVFQTSKSAQRRAKGARSDLELSLQTLASEHLDLWQIHDVRTEQDLEVIAGPGGALEAFVAAKEQGLVRHIGVTGHHDPMVLNEAVRQWPLDAVLLPVNPVEAVLGGFVDQTISLAREQGMAVIAMKVLGASHYLAPKQGVTAGRLIRFALGQGVDLAIVGCSSAAEVKTLAQAGEQGPLDSEEQRELLEIFAPSAQRLAFYRKRA